MIKGYCRTNLDDFKTQEWPRLFVAIPHIGDRVESSQGRILYVVGVTHCVAQKDSFYGDIKKDDPYIQVELHQVGAVSRR